MTEAESLLKQIESAEADCQRWAAKVEGLRGDLKLARESYEEAVLHLRMLARSRAEEMPLFDDTEE